MSLETKPDIAINVHVQPESQLTPADQSWLTSYGVDPSWQNNSTFLDELSQVIATGSLRLDEPINQTPQAHSDIMAAREWFFNFLRIPDDTLVAFLKTHPTIIPLDTFIGSQRVMAELGLNAAKVINTNPVAISLAPESIRAKLENLAELGLNAAKVINAVPAAISYAPESVRTKFENLAELGLDAAKVINAVPAAISYAPESVRTKFENLAELGLDAAKVINTNPVVISLAPKSVRAKFENLAELGLDATKVINALPAAIGLAPESVRAKFENLAELGLDATKVINALPAAIGLAPESVRTKMRLLDRITRLLRWEHSAKELIETFPAILGHNKQKLLIEARIAAYNLDESARSSNPQQVRSGLIIPLEQFILALADTDQNGDAPQTLPGLYKKASGYRRSPEERREQALQSAPSLGKVGIRYLRYRKQ